VHSTSVRSAMKEGGFRGAGGIARKDARSLQTINIISLSQYFVARFLR
jgi:hypothetical protein